MPLAIKATSSNVNANPTHAAGDLLIAVHWGVSAATYNSGWTVLADFGTVWYYDNFSVAYRVATDSSTSAPWSTYSGNNGYAYGSRVYAVGGAKSTGPIAGSVVSANSIADTTITVPSVTASSLRFTVVQGVGGGGNPDITSSTLTGTGVTNNVADEYLGIWLGGTGALTISAPSNWYKRYVTFSIAAAPESGFFAMF